MRALLSVAAILIISGANVFAHQAFTLVSSEKLTLTEAQLAALQKQATVGKIDGADLSFAGNDIKIVFTAGPEDDMLSYRVQGLRNPTIVTPSDAKITVWFVNTDDDMPHDLIFAHYPVDFTETPDTAMSAGTQRVRAHEGETAPFNAEKIVITSNEDGAYRYFCSVKGHAKGGMWGNILVGIKPGPQMQMPGKSNTMPGMDMSPKTTPTPTDRSSMPGMDMSPKPTPTPADMSSMPGMKVSPNPTPSPAGDMSNMPGMNKQGDMSSMSGMDHGNMAMKMSSTVNLGDPMERESSGTAWAPDSSPMYARVQMKDDGSMWMFMGEGFVRYTRIGGSRDVSVAGRGRRDKFDAPTMFMAMYSHPWGKKAQFGFRTMLSLDPVIERGFGYPLLYQSGESFGGRGHDGATSSAPSSDAPPIHGRDL